MKEKRALVLSSAEFRRTVAVARETRHGLRNTAILHMSFALGLRAKELALLRINDVLSIDGQLRDEVLLTRSSTKGGKQRLIYLSNRKTRKALIDYLQTERKLIARGSDALFQSAKGGAFTPNTMQMLFKRIYVAAGLPDASSHSGRRTFATSLIENGIDIKSVSTLMGHSNINMTARYVEDNPLRLQRICEGITL